MTDAGLAPHDDAPRDKVPGWTRLFFVVHPNGSRELDLGWLILAIAFVNGLAMWDYIVIAGLKTIPSQWTWYGAVITMAFIAGAAVSRARLIAKHAAGIGAIAQGIGSAVGFPLDTDDGREEGDDRAPIISR